MGPVVELSRQVLWWILSLGLAAGLGLGVAMLVLHAWRKRHLRLRAEATGSLSMAFARYATGSTSAAELAARVSGAPAEAFWQTLENYADAVSGDEWTKVASVVSRTPHVQHELRNLEHRTAWRRAIAARHIGMLSLDAPLERLRTAMERGPMMVTFTAALALARLHDRQTLVWLLEHPQATDGQDRHRLTALLKRFGREFVADLRNALIGCSQDSTIALAAIETLGIFRDLDSRELLEQFVRESGLEARASAARALGALRSPASAPVLCRALDDPAWQVRAQAARSLGDVRSDIAIEPLARATSDSSWWVRRNTAYSLARQGERGLDELLRLSQLSPDRYVREMTVEVLQMLEWDRRSRGGIARVE